MRAQPRLAVAPMIDWTDRHCRAFHRLLSPGALLYTEMVVAQAAIHGDRERLLARGAPGPMALQLGGCDPALLAEATRAAAPFGYDEINLNVGCPSDRVQAGTFGAVLMKTPETVAACVAAMSAAFGAPVSVKCRLGVDDQEPRETLPRFLEAMQAAGVRKIILHARKAWLAGLSPRENREIPPLDYALAAEMVRAFPGLEIWLNGGIASLDEAARHLDTFAGVMIGRAAYHDPAAILAPADARLHGGAPGPSAAEAARAMRPVIAAHVAAGGQVHHITRHMLGLFHGRPGAKLWRQRLSGGGLTLEAYDAALEAVAG